MQDVILHLPDWLSTHELSQQPDQVTVLFLITGNPGLIGYYKTFLQLLAHGSGKDAIVAGASLGGFQTNSVLEEDSLKRELLFPPSYKQRAIYNLTEQIELSQARLEQLIGRIRNDYASVANLPFRVILIGHSVGAYIALEIVRKCSRFSGSLSEAKAETTNSPLPYEILATILLTPTICDIAHSPSGKIATPVLSTLPFFPVLTQLGANVLTSTLGKPWLRYVVGRITGMKDSIALDTTVSFLITAGAVKQALYMARCEMLEIGQESWSEEVWGVAEFDASSQQNISTVEIGGDAQFKAGATTTWKAPKHYFLFAKEDHWVANVTRDSIVQGLNGRADFIIDEDGSMGLVHAWCLHQNDMVAEIVDRWMKQILAQHRD